jgi:hypothetical protein
LRDAQHRKRIMRKPEKERPEGYDGGLIIDKKVISYCTCFT